MPKPTLLLDKNYLQGSPASVIRELATTHTLLMPDVLFYELISSSEPGRSRCFAKLPPGENPIVLLKNLGSLLKKEMRTHEACGLPSKNVEEIRFQFHADMSRLGYELPEESVRELEEQAATLELEVAQYLVRAETVKRLFPKLEEAFGDERDSLREAAETVIADFALMRNFYASMASHSQPGPFTPPPAELVGPEWACVCLMQVHLLFGIELLYRFGTHNFPKAPKGRAYERFEHDVLDANYLILGVLEGSLATHEKKLRRWFRLLRPDGRLHPDDGLSLKQSV